MPVAKTRNRCCYDDLNFSGGHELPLEPTPYLPGSSEKIEVLSSRFDHRISLWHPKDSVIDESGAPFLFPGMGLNLLHSSDAADGEETDGD